MLPDTVYSGRWTRAITLVSLDAALPFYDMMGLRVDAPSQFQSQVRAFIKRTRILFANTTEEGNTAQVTDIIAHLRSTVGQPSAQVFDWWIGNRYCEHPREKPVLRAWTLICRKARHDDIQWAELSLPPRLSVLARRQFERSVDRHDYRRLSSDVTSRPRSDWDLHFYAIYLWDEEADEIPTGPSTMISPILECAQGYDYWNWLLPQLSAQEVEELHRGGARIATAAPELRYLGTIPSPISLLEVPRDGHAQ